MSEIKNMPELTLESQAAAAVPELTLEPQTAAAAAVPQLTLETVAPTPATPAPAPVVEEKKEAPPVPMDDSLRSPEEKAAVEEFEHDFDK